MKKGTSGKKAAAKKKLTPKGRPPAPPPPSGVLLCAAGKHEVGHPSLPCDACADESAQAVHRDVCIEAEVITQVQNALTVTRQFLELVKAPLLGSAATPDLPVEQVIREAKEAEAVLQSALIQSLTKTQS